MNKDRALLEAIHRAQTEYMINQDPTLFFESLLQEFVKLTDSQYGFIAELFHKNDQSPYLIPRAITDISWDEESHKMYMKFIKGQLQFSKLNSLYGQVMATQAPIIANDAPHDPRKCGIPKGHPALNKFLGIPLISSSNDFVGVLGLANRPKGYNQKIIAYINPMIVACANVIANNRIEHQRQIVVAELTEIRKELETRVLQRTAELIESKERMNNALHSAEVGTWIWVIPEDLVIFDDHMHRLFGMNPDNFHGNLEASIHLLHPEDQKRVKQDVETAVSKNSKFETDFRVIWPDGSVHFLSARGKTYTDPLNQPIQFTGVCWDITDRVKAERTLTEVNEKFSSIVSQNVIAILIVDMQYIILYANQIANTFFHKKSHDLTGQHFDLPIQCNSSCEIKIFLDNDKKGIGEMEVVKTTWLDQPAYLVVIHDITAQKNVARILEEKTKSLLRAKNRLTKLTSYDLLTGLQNRKLFQWAISQAIGLSNRLNTEFAILLIDIDNFKWINDTFGHDVGDATLKKLASILKGVSRKGDVIARIGGDEFAIILNEIENYGYAINIAHQILNTFKAPINIDEKIVHISVSIGATFYPLPKKNGNDSETENVDSMNLLLKQADIALYKAKRIGKGMIALFSERAQMSYAMMNEIEQALQFALDKKEFTLFYQPIINMESRQIIGAEALLRWNNDTLGNISPVDFIPIAERNGIIHKIGLWVFNEVCKQASVWRKQGIKNLFIAVNVSPIQLRKPLFTHKIARITEKYHIDPSQIEIEITESSIRASNDFFSPKFLNFIKHSQIKLSIDDFGTGYSSLARLAELPVSTLKIDGSFIKHMEQDDKNFNIVKSAIALAKSLSIKTIAECVETKEQAEILLKLDCELAQGYYYYKPIPVEAFSALFQGETDIR